MDLKKIFSQCKSIAIVGVSNDQTKASTIVMKYMQEYGFKVFPVNPSAKGQKILGEEVFAKITDIKSSIDIVDVFRPCLLYTSPSPRDGLLSRMPSSA